jgi:coenzyme F420-reducing hydrogenase delta subunit
MTLICERSCDLKSITEADSQFKGMPDCYFVKFPCSGMIQPLMIEAALKNGADGVVVTGCQIGDCYFREGNKMIRERLLGERTPGLKKTVDRRRVIGLWLSRMQPQRLLSEIKDFSSEVSKLPVEAKPEPKPAAAKPAPKPVVEVPPAPVVEVKTEDKPEVKPEAKPE